MCPAQYPANRAPGWTSGGVTIVLQLADLKAALKLPLVVRSEKFSFSGPPPVLSPDGQYVAAAEGYRVVVSTPPQGPTRQQCIQSKGLYIKIACNSQPASAGPYQTAMYTKQGTTHQRLHATHSMRRAGACCGISRGCTAVLLPRPRQAPGVLLPQRIPPVRA